MEVFAVGAPETILAPPGSVELMNASRKLLWTEPDRRDEYSEPEADLLAVVARGETEQTFQAVRPGQRAGAYIPIPNRIIRGSDNDLKIVRIRCRNDFEGCRMLCLRMVFIEFAFF